MNGLFVNGRRVKEAPLEPGDVVRLGEWVGVALELERGDDSAPAAYGTIAPGLIGGNRAAGGGGACPARGAQRPGDHRRGRDRHGQGGGRARGARGERAQRRVPGRQLRGAARAAGRGGAVRLPAGRVHRRRPRQPGALPVGAARDVAARRDHRPAARPCRPRCCGCSSSARWCRSANRSPCRSTCASSSPRRNRWRRRWRQALPGRPVRPAGRADRALAAAARSPGRRARPVLAPDA